MYKIGDYCKLNTAFSVCIWQIKRIDPVFELVSIETNAGLIGQQIKFTELYSSYIKTDKDGNPIKDDQLDFFGGGFGSWEGLVSNPGYSATLPQGLKSTECSHVWKRYDGLNFSDEMCTKCPAKRELK